MKKIIYILLFLISINLQAVEEIQLQWEDISPSNDYVLEREIFLDNKENIYTKPYYYLYKYSNSDKKWSTIDIPEIDEDFKDNIKVFANYKSDLVIYSVNKNEIFIKNNIDNDWTKYYLEFDNDTLKNAEYRRLRYYNDGKALFYVTSNNFNYKGNVHVDFVNFEYKIYNNEWSTFPNRDIIYNSKNEEYYGITSNNIGFLDENLEIKGESRPIDIFNYLNQYTESFVPEFVGLVNSELSFICLKENNISLLKTNDLGYNWSLLATTKIIDNYEIDRFPTYVKNNYIVLVLKDKSDELLTKLMISDDYGKNWVLVSAPKLESDFTGYQHIFINNNKELFLFEYNKFYKTKLTGTELSVENEATPPLKNLSVLYGNISDNILNINIESGISSNAKVSLYSSDMREIEQFSNVDFMQGKNELTFNINTTLSTGAYYVFIESGNYKHFYRIIKN